MVKVIDPTGKKTVHLLSCSNEKAAKKLSKRLGARNLQATDAIVKVHSDGGITTIARSKNGSQKWYNFQNGKRIREIKPPKKPEGKAKREGVLMGDPALLVSKFKIGEMYRNVQPLNNRLEIEYFFRSKVETRGFPSGENINKNTKHWIGTYRVWYRSDGGVMEADLHVPAKIKRLYSQDPDMRLGKTMFKDAYEYYTKRHGEIKYMYAGWEKNNNYEKGLSDNLEEYLGNLSKGMTKADAALNTNAGRKLSSFGYSKVHKVDDSNLEDVKVWFVKPNKYVRYSDFFKA